MTKKQKQRRKERRRNSTLGAQEQARLDVARQRQRRLKPTVERFYVPPRRSWLSLQAMPLRASKCAVALRKAGLPVFEAREHVKLAAENGKERIARVPIMRRLMFVGIATLADLARIEACPLVARVLSSAADGAFLWIDRDGFRAPWIEAETFGKARMPVIRRAEMRKFADHVMGYMCDDELADGVFATLFAVGSTVRVVSGPFASFNGTIEEHDDTGGLYTVNVDIFGRSTLLRVEERKLQAA